MTNVHQLPQTFALLTPALGIHPEACDAGLYERLDRNYDDCKGATLVSCHAFSEDWGMWELHPHGDELVMLLDGHVTLVLRQDDGDKEVTLTEPLSYVIVPKNTWHTARTKVATRMVFVTPGEGTRNEVFD
ncbi:MAG: cupin [Pseudomonadota bacterium]